MLTEYTIDVFRDNDEAIDDVNLDEFADVVDEWIIEEFKKAGFGTAREVLSATRDELISRVDVEEETIDDILKILAAEFNEDASDVEEEPVAEETEEADPCRNQRTYHRQFRLQRPTLQLGHCPLRWPRSHT